jgi:uncharacterized OsmC-like protein
MNFGELANEHKDAVYRRMPRVCGNHADAEDGGFDEGMTPPELMLASLSACAGFYAADYLKRQSWRRRGRRFG